MPRTNKHNKKAAKHSHPSSQELFTQIYPSLTGFMCDNKNGATPATNAAMREHMQKPEAASAFYKHLMARDLSGFDPAAPCPLPPATKALLREYFPGHPIN